MILLSHVTFSPSHVYFFTFHENFSSILDLRPLLVPLSPLYFQLCLAAFRRRIVDEPFPSTVQTESYCFEFFED